jgi:hypothetical protein
MQIIVSGGLAENTPAGSDKPYEQTPVLPDSGSGIAAAGAPCCVLRNIRNFRDQPGMNPQSTYHALPRYCPAQPGGMEHGELPVAELTLVRLRGDREIGSIRSLRDEIDLPVSALRDPSFRALEKKETSWASWGHLNARAN